MARIGYIRVSTEEQNTARQTEQLKGLDKLFIEKVSGKDINRPELMRLMDYIRDGDIVVVESISRFARNTKDLLELIDKLKSKGVAFISLKESIDTSTPQGQFILTVFAALAQLERECILQRQAEGIAIAKAEGKYKGRRPVQIDEYTFRDICSHWRSGDISATEAIKKLKLKPNTFYRRVKMLNL